MTALTAPIVSDIDGGEEKKAEQKESKNEYKNRLALINGDESIDPKEAESVSAQMKELLENARANVSREKWAQGERTTGMASKVNQHLDWWIETNMGTYRSMAHQFSAKKALAASTLKYMMNQEKGGELLGFALKHAGLDAMEEMIMGSDSFRNRVEQLDLSDPEQVKDCMEDRELFTKPLGDKLLHMTEKVLEEEAPLVEKQDRINMLKVAEDDIARDLKKSEKALENSNAEDAARYGAEALVQQTVAGLLKLTAGKAGDPYAVRKMVHNSNVFKEELKKLDLSKPGAVKGALDARFGSAAAGSIMRLSQKTGDDLGDGEKSPTGKAAQTETIAQNGVLPRNGK